MGFELDASYKQVPERLADLKAKHPEGCVRPVDPARPYWIEVIGDKTFIVYAAAAYRSPDDPMPGIGLAWEQFPGKTPYTKDSELQNAETSAWGRAIVAVLASESKAVASAEDMRNRQADHAEPEPVSITWASKEEVDLLRSVVKQIGNPEVGEWPVVLGVEIVKDGKINVTAEAYADVWQRLAEYDTKPVGEAVSA